ncbi:type II toxin-antitoxin system VapC family toxin [Pseudorhodoferax sp.]|uniref:type II toxin-antitoxin system VapC family toxin n=1 Tax=Pseudorhodoferax sp. TaxID=1993553 RepID=UPI002DD62F9D|nr:type II toxin-antitoxin system VapC family toxin [Pseudorhodoferax sp.]
MSPSAPPSRRLYVAEPPAAWAQLPPVVVDCSVLAAVLWAEPAAAAAREHLAGHSLHAPALLGIELANVACSKCRSGVPDAVARAGLEAFAEQRIVLHESEPAALFDLAQQHALTAYDAAYLALALSLNAPLVTFDQKLAAAAGRALGNQPG